MHKFIVVHFHCESYVYFVVADSLAKTQIGKKKDAHNSLVLYNSTKNIGAYCIYREDTSANR